MIRQFQLESLDVIHLFKFFRLHKMEYYEDIKEPEIKDKVYVDKDDIEDHPILKISRKYLKYHDIKDINPNKIRIELYKKQTIFFNQNYGEQAIIFCLDENIIPTLSKSMMTNLKCLGIILDGKNSFRKTLKKEDEYIIMYIKK